MDFTLSDDHLAFRDTMRDFVDKEIRPVANEYERSGRYPTEIVEHMKAMGLFGLTTPEEYGGLGVDTITMAIVFEEIARGWMGVAGIIGSHSLACRMIAIHGTEEQKQEFLPRFATGELRTGIGLTEPGAGSDLQGITCRAVKDGDDYIVTGTKTWITNARYASPLPVLVVTDPDARPRHRGTSMLLIDADSEGYVVSKDLPKLGYKGTESCEIVLDNVRVPSSRLLGGVEGIGFKQAIGGLEIGRINIAARSVGIAQEAFDVAVSYSREREAFGQPISDFQAIQLKIADMATDVQAARLLTYWAAAKVDSGERADMEAGMAKYFASETAIKNSMEAMRVLGGYGYSEEYPVARLYRDAPLMSIGEGTNDIQRMIIAKSIIKDYTGGGFL